MSSSRIQSLGRRILGHAHAVFVIVALVSVVLGVVGLRSLPSSTGPMRWDDALFQSIQLFVLEFNAGAPDGLPWTLNVARFLSPALTAYAAIQAAFILLTGFRERLRRKRFRRHCIVCGLGKHGRYVALNAVQAGHRVIAIDPNPDAEVITACGQRNISLIRGNAADRATLTEAGITRAGELYIFGPDDNVNLEIAHAVRRTRAESQVLSSRTLPPLTCFLSVDELRLASLIPAHHRFLEFPANMQVHAFNRHQNAARDLWRRMTKLAIEKRQCLPLAIDDNRTAHVFIAGSGEASRAVFEQIARLAHFANGTRTRISWIDPVSADDFSGLAPVLDVRGIRAPFRSPEATMAWVNAALEPDTLVSVVVCQGPDTPNLRTALDINDRARQAGFDLPVFVLTANAAGIHEFLDGEADSHDILLNVYGFGALSDTCSLDAILRPRITALAQAIHAWFHGDGHIPTDPGAWAEAWNRLPEHLKETNRVAAEHLRIKGLVLGFDSDRGEIPDAASVEKHLESLAALEHRRWMAEKLLTGWHPGKTTDPLHLTHQDLVCWDELPEVEKEKDRSQVRAMGEMVGGGDNLR